MSTEKDVIKDLVELSGTPVGMNEPMCIIWKFDHENCKGCPSELGCCKCVKLKYVLFMPLLYHPQNFEDFQKMHTRMQELHQMILDAKSVEEVEEIPMV